jgi:squalene-hopene/tetraprenyl-beta-curcumene cyclase
MQPDDPALTQAVQWMLGEEIAVRGDWSVKRPDLAPGGWAFEFANDGYPDVDDTAEVVLALRHFSGLLPGVREAARRGVDWVIGMQSRDGGWAAFDADNTRRLVERLPFCDFGAVIDPPSADVTAHTVEMLAYLGERDSAVTARGVQWLLDAQEPDGAWFGRWGANLVYGTGAVVPALVAAGVAPDSIPVRRAVRWLQEHQNADGGWGEDLRSYRDPSWRGKGASTASQTAWALLALLAVDPHTEAVARGVDWLVRTQRADGCWDEDLYTGTGFPGDFYINYELYRLVFPLSALGRYLAAKRGAQ